MVHLSQQLRPRRRVLPHVLAGCQAAATTAHATLTAAGTARRRCSPRPFPIPPALSHSTPRAGALVRAAVPAAVARAGRARGPRAAGHRAPAGLQGVAGGLLFEHGRCSAGAAALRCAAYDGSACFPSACLRQVGEITTTLRKPFRFYLFLLSHLPCPATLQVEEVTTTTTLLILFLL